MGDFVTKTKPYLWLLIPLVLSLLFGVFIYLFFTQGGPDENGPSGNLTTTNSPITPTGSTISNGGIDEVWPTGFEDFYGDTDASGLEGIEKVENLPDGTKKYTATSPNPARPNILVARNDKTIYQRKVVQSGADIPLQNFIEQFGQPERVIGGPAFYGSTTFSEYIFAKNGVSIIVNNQSGQVVEQIFFRPTTVDNYLSAFGNDGSPRI